METTHRYREKLTAALYCLAVREGDVRERLRGAYRYLRMLSPSEIPVTHREEIEAILQSCTRYGPVVGADNEVLRTSLEHTMKRIKKSTGRGIAEKIYRLACEL